MRTKLAPLLVLVLAGCAGAKPSSQPQKPAPTVSAPNTQSDQPGPDVVPEQVAPAGSRFAPSPITGLAEQVVQLVRAALHGESLPAVDFPIERHRPDEKLVRSQEPVPRDLDFVAFGMELEIALVKKPGAGDDATQGLECELLLSRHGLKLISLESESVSDPKPAPRWAPLNALADELVADLRQDRIERWLIGDADKALLGPMVTREIETDQLKPAELEQAKQLAISARGALGFKLDDLGILAKDARGGVWVLELQFESGDNPELDSHPLVRVERFEH